MSRRPLRTPTGRYAAGERPGGGDGDKGGGSGGGDKGGGSGALCARGARGTCGACGACGACVACVAVGGCISEDLGWISEAEEMIWAEETSSGGTDCGSGSLLRGSE